MKEKSIGLLIINYNGMKFLPELLPEIFAECEDSSVKLLVCDDQSTDGSLDYVKHLGVSYLSNTSTSHGYAANANVGLKELYEHSTCKYFIVANNDIKLSKGIFKRIEQTLSHLDSALLNLGLIGFREVIAKQHELLNKPEFFTNTNTPELVDEIPGFFFLITRELLGTIGYMDEEYYMYGEDNDYYIRALKAGFSIYQSNIPVYHFSEGSSTNHKMTSWYVYRNAFLFAQKNLGLKGVMKMFLSFVNQIYNPFYKPSNPGNVRVIRNGFFYNNYLLGKSIFWNFRYYLKNKSDQLNILAI